MVYVKNRHINYEMWLPRVKGNVSPFIRFIFGLEVNVLTMEHLEPFLQEVLDPETGKVKYTYEAEFATYIQAIFLKIVRLASCLVNDVSPMTYPRAGFYFPDHYDANRTDLVPGWPEHVPSPNGDESSPNPLRMLFNTIEEAVECFRQYCRTPIRLVLWLDEAHNRFGNVTMPDEFGKCWLFHRNFGRATADGLINAAIPQSAAVMPHAFWNALADPNNKDLRSCTQSHLMINIPKPGRNLDRLNKAPHEVSLSSVAPQFTEEPVYFETSHLEELATGTPSATEPPSSPEEKTPPPLNSSPPGLSPQASNWQEELQKDQEFQDYLQEQENEIFNNSMQETPISRSKSPSPEVELIATSEPVSASGPYSPVLKQEEIEVDTLPAAPTGDIDQSIIECCTNFVQSAPAQFILDGIPSFSQYVNNAYEKGKKDVLDEMKRLINSGAIYQDFNFRSQNVHPNFQQLQNANNCPEQAHAIPIPIVYPIRPPAQHHQTVEHDFVQGSSSSRGETSRELIQQAWT
jgi:hypothetical protein